MIEGAKKNQDEEVELVWEEKSKLLEGTGSFTGYRRKFEGYKKPTCVGHRLAQDRSDSKPSRLQTSGIEAKLNHQELETIIVQKP